MTILTIDTHKIVEILTERGFSQEQAKGILQAAKEVNMDALVTKEYLNTRLEQMDIRLERRFDKIDARFEQIDSRFEPMELRMLVRHGAMIFALGGLLIALKFFG